ncbi:hypothetical protein COCSUDRAFT_57173 [Coccomyxa subellipsoidea C-169]|uniref:MYND-type domain-containing protein n=1 Tax=Coccomyxa subellipsoidea (strain C-169) TaxID=574566 RepID=I0YSA1_COCSC|nr:hypothetical protein COCSUDRAFT_57173 [Coccomyxa subellipsoidea C-169]EIE21270.1 hypothetical protein COCSUDRAFT_57173 [Coccomyxa subellipsoidea C-169]|eukprot:XP_005645814.1 hypothetical protein COCSUDRAFT_57173 [Coccomyxa subellipsoidea C-169]
MVGHLVACGNAMYLFGGRDILDNGKLRATNDMHKFVPNWKEENGVMTDLTSIVCTRVAAGVASNEDRAVIVGGWTAARPEVTRAEKVLWLADVWEYHFDLNCWIQVVPADKKQAWISGRQTSACGFVDNDTLLCVGGHGPADPTERNMLAHFTYTPGPALALHASLNKQGRWRDPSVERACKAVAELRSAGELAHVPEKMQQLYGAPEGSVTMLTPDVWNIATGILTPSDDSNLGVRNALPPGCKLCQALQLPLRPLTDQGFWGSGCRPFELTPRWLTSPCEVSANLIASRPDESQNQPGTMRHVVKQLGTAKAAAEYFRLCQPDLAPESDQDYSARWRPVQVCRGCRLVRYCSPECQLADWENHKPVCKHFSAPDKSA